MRRFRPTTALAVISALAALALLLAACSGAPSLTVTALTPSSGGAGTTLTLTGSGFDAATVVTVCEASLLNVTLTADGRTASAPGTVGSLPGLSILTGTVPDLGSSAECSVVLTRADGSTVTWSRTFAYSGTPADPGNQPPSANGLSDLLITGEEDQRIIDLSSAFDDPDDGAAALTFTASVTAPDGNVTASVTAGELTLGFPSRLGGAAQVTLTASDPHGATTSEAFEVTFEAGGIMVTTSGLPVDAQVTRTARVSDSNGHLLDLAWDESVQLRPGDYTFAVADATTPGTYVGERFRAEPAAARVDAGGDSVVTLTYGKSGGSGRLWLPAWLGGLNGFSDEALANGSTQATTTIDNGWGLTAAALAPDGALWVSSDMAIYKFDPSDLELPQPLPSLTLTSSVFSFVTNITFDAEGNLWVADFYSSSVQMFTATQVAAAGQQSPSLRISRATVGALVYPSGLAFDAAGNLWVGTSDFNVASADIILRFDAADLLGSDPQPSLTITSELEGARHFSFAFDAAGDLWYTTEFQYIGHIPAADLTKTGQLTDDPRLGITLPTTHVIALNFDPKGNLWAVSREGLLMTVLAAELTQAAPLVAGRDLAATFDTGAFVFID